MEAEKLLQEVKENFATVIAQEGAYGLALWEHLIEVHPADLAQFCADISRDDFELLFLALPHSIRVEVFSALSRALQAYSLSFMDEHDKAEVLAALPVDELSDLFDSLSDAGLKEALSLLNKKVRGEVLRILEFDSESAGGIMDTQVFTLMQDFTVEQSIKLLQRLRPSREIHQQIYVLNEKHQLVGHINLEDLVLEPSATRISTFLRDNDFVAQAHEDQEKIAQKMVHYSLMTIPVVDELNHFLGVIPSDTLVDVLVEEATEDVQKMSALGSHKQSYFETSFFRQFYERMIILVGLLLCGSVSGVILKSYEATLEAALLFFVPMLVSAGGNTSSQTSALVIQGMATGDIHHSNMSRFLRRESLMALMLAVVLGITAFFRIYYFTGGATLIQSFAVSAALSAIVMVSVLLGSCIPLLLKKYNIDPAFSAGPVLATIMDILGVMIYCQLLKLILY